MPLRPSLLFIDPRPAEVQALATALAAAGRVIVLESLDAAWTLMLREAPELVLIDVDATDGSGWKFARRVREHRLFARVPVVLMSARFDLATERAGLQIGAADVLAKPLDSEIAPLRVSGHLERARIGTALMRSLRAGGMALWDGTALHCRVTDGAGELLGLDDGELLPWASLVHPLDLPRLQEMLETLETQAASAATTLYDTVSNGALRPHGAAAPRQAALDLRLRRQDGRWIWAALQGRITDNPMPRRFTTSGAATPLPLNLAGTLFDISRRKQLEAAVRAREAGLRSLIGSLHDLVLALDGDGKVLSCHLPAEFELDLPDGPWLGRPVDTLLPEALVHLLHEARVGLALDGRRRSFECSWPAATQGEPAMRLRHGLASLSLLQAPQDGAGNGTRAHGDARPGWVSGHNPAIDDDVGMASAGATRLGGLDTSAHWASAAHMGDSVWGQATLNAPGALLVLRDITELKVEEEAVRQLAYFDPLTTLPNRRLLHDRLRQVQAGSQRRGRHGALLFIDLDHFKQVNDRWGHRCGDQLLVELARRLQVSVRACDTVARLGGDEFVVVLADLDPQESIARGQLGQICSKMLARLARSYDLDGRRHQCTASLGAVLFLGNEPGMDHLIAQADAAMYRAKAAGRNALRISDGVGGGADTATRPGEGAAPLSPLP
jgi:diguanylate cyclase (GGDEF)-like protein